MGGWMGICMDGWISWVGDEWIEGACPPRG